MEQINKVYEKQYSPSENRIHNKSTNSKSHNLLGDSTWNKNSFIRKHPIEK